MKNFKFKGEQLADVLTAAGLPVELVGESESPHDFYYHFNYKNVYTFTKSKQNNAVARLRIVAKFPDFAVVPSDMAHFAIKQPKAYPDIVYLAQLQTPPPLSFVAGVNKSGEQINISLDEMTHALVAGCTGSGKTVFLKCLIERLDFGNNSKAFNFAIIDKKQSLNFFKNSPNCLAVGNSEFEAFGIIKEFQNEMQRRYKSMRKMKIEKNEGQFPKWCLIVDELAELMLGDMKADIGKMLVSLCQLGRAAGIHCILCTQSPRVAVVTGLIQANTPTKIIFKTSSTRESVLCLSHGGAEQLRGNGDCLIKLPHLTNEIHAQAPYQCDEIYKALYKERD